MHIFFKIHNLFYVIVLLLSLRLLLRLQRRLLWLLFLFFFVILRCSEIVERMKCQQHLCCCCCCCFRYYWSYHGKTSIKRKCNAFKPLVKTVSNFSYRKSTQFAIPWQIICGVSSFVFFFCNRVLGFSAWTY